MFNIVNSVRPVAVLEAPAFFKGNTCQVAVAATVTLTEKDVPLMAAILSTLESNQQRTITDVFRGYQDLSAEELRLKAQQRIRQRAEARSGIPDLDVDEFVHKTGGITGKQNSPEKRWTKSVSELICFIRTTSQINKKHKRKNKPCSSKPHVLHEISLANQHQISSSRYPKKNGPMSTAYAET